MAATRIAARTRRVIERKSAAFERAFSHLALRLDLSRIRGRVSILGTPGMFFLAGPETGEVTAAGGAAIRRGAEPEHHERPARRVVILLAPGGQLLTVAARAAGVFPGSVGPDAGCPARAAAAATQRINTEEGTKLLGKTLFLRHADISRPAFWTGKLHSDVAAVSNYNAVRSPGPALSDFGWNAGAGGHIGADIGGKCLLQAIPHVMPLMDRQSVDGRDGH